MKTDTEIMKSNVGHFKTPSLCCGWIFCFLATGVLHFTMHQSFCADPPTSRADPRNTQGGQENKTKTAQTVTNSSRNVTTVYETKQELVLALTSFLGDTIHQGRGFAKIQDSKDLCRFDIQADRAILILQIPLLVKSSGNSTKGFSGARDVALTNPPPDLPTLYAIKAPASELSKFTNFLASENVRISQFANELLSEQRVVGYNKSISIACGPQPDRLTNTVRYIVFNLFANSSGPYQVTRTVTK